ncbi:MAG: MBL fold metallo-hydrolase [Thaumarchaeota archaeon]|nr:MBL fold metallo-hydrolase [Nitrososphaerota archaeon]
MNLRFLASDSLGTRSMCSLIETEYGRIMIDPGAALGPRRYGLRPHEIEFETLKKHKEKIAEEAEDVDLFIITHYHYDHFPRPSENIEWLKGKRILIKDPSNMINFSQRWRSKIFLDKLRKVGAKPKVADSKRFRLGRCKIKFSNPVKHGNDERLGYILEVLIETDDGRILYTSDVEGIVDDDQLNFILKSEPNIVICDGPMTYMLGTRFSEMDLKKSILNLVKVLNMETVEVLILDHHLLRDLEWKTWLKSIFEESEILNKKVLTAASYMGVEENLLEARRRELYGIQPSKPSNL